MYIVGYLILVILSVFTIAYTILILYLQFLPGAFYYPTKDKKVKTIFQNLQLKKNDLLIDLGSGDGRIVINAAQKGIHSIGYELNPFLVKKSRQKIEKLGLSQLATIKAKNFWKANFDQATIVCIYQFPQYMGKFEEIFKKIQHPLIVISNSYPLPNKKPYLIKDKLYFYKFP